MKPLIRNLLIIAVALGAIGLLIGLYMFNKKDPNLSKVKPDYVIEVTSLVNEFSQDENAASAKYVDKVLEVTGPVQGIEPTSDSTMNVTLSAENQMAGVICSFKSTADPSSQNIKEGEIITIRGVCSGMLMDILLNNCVIVK
jgi:tRNA_anti-like